MSIHKLPRYLLAGALSGGITGLADVITTISNGTAKGSVSAVLTIGVFAAVSLQIIGWLLGIAIFAISPIIPTDTKIRNGLRLLRRPSLALSVVLLSAVFSGTAVFIGYRKGIMVDAIDFRPLALASLFLGIFVLVYRVLTPRIRRRASLMTVLFFASLLTLAVMTPKVGRADQALLVGRQTALVKMGITSLKRSFDKDGDGFSTLLCDNDCDCDDTNAARNPAALEIPGNGLDEDCNGKDLLPGAMTVATTGRIPEAPSVHLKTPFNIVLITIDALRADRMHLYGHTRKTTPYLDGLAANSVWFKQVRSQGPSTRHAFPVLLTGRYFSTLSLKKGKKWSRLLPENTTFAERLKTKGYRTVAVLPYFRFKEQSGFSQGFDVWEPVLDTDRDATWDPTGDLVTDRGITHLETLAHQNAPWLLWLHYFDPHASYVNHDDQASFGTTKADRYDGEILFVDRQIRRFMAAFEKTGLENRTAVIVTSDHGEGIGLPTDHGFTYHGFSLFDSETRIPLIIRLPDARPNVIDDTCVALIDLPPTLMALAGIPQPQEMHGHSLIPYLFGKPPFDHPPFLMQLPEKSMQHAIVDWPFKLIWESELNRFSLFDLKRDPNEQVNLVDQSPDTADRLKEALKRQLYDLQR